MIIARTPIDDARRRLTETVDWHGECVVLEERDQAYYVSTVIRAEQLRTSNIGVHMYTYYFGKKSSKMWVNLIIN